MPKRKYSGGSTSGYKRSAKRIKTRSTGVPSSYTGYFRRTGYYGRYSGSRRFRLASRPERKYFDVSHTESALSSSGTILEPSLNLVNGGTAPNNMLGRKMIIRRITIRGYAQLVGQTSVAIGSVHNANTARILLIQDKQCNGAAATIGDIFSTTSWEAMQLLQNSRRFKILKTWIMDLNTELSYDGSSDFFCGKVNCAFEWSKKCFIPIETTGATSKSITDIKSNNLLLVGFNSAGSDVVFVDFITRIRFEDN